MLNKILSLAVLLRYGKLPWEHRYFYRDTLRCQVQQWKYIWQDYVVRKKYKKLAFSGEFAPELQFVLPFAYWHYQNGTLESTVSSKYTKELYFFSPDHREQFDTRSNEGNYNFEMPRVLYSQDYDMSKWIPVPLKATYQNDIYVYEKPILIIANRYNMEWDGPPVSFYSIEMLAFILDKLKSKYTVIYNRPRPQHITMDNSDIYDMDEFSWLAAEHPDVILMEDLFKENRGNAGNFNHLQLMVYANASRFISIHGGTATLASYFGGTNLILSKKGPEHYFKCFEKLYPQFSGAKILHAKTDDEVKQYVEAHF
ncbi:hypothetical protein GCM10010967_19470 [Dyadobacter beijingensis]|uniref:Glycosyltransferase family 61 protein n=1 Tax=Dyadobacter beijingensis TaxID=365489 RepID=A0ABQ2HNV5_9BACT|nr:hypothetical protein [Dyadobacter beijingensis]GGM87176.1 hypothetical protein GCM10010967_19470 [Dyadobacter beijingensis]